jgi:hypothetical protein
MYRRRTRATCGRRAASRARHQFRRKLAIEPLEGRRLLSGVPDLVLLGGGGGTPGPPNNAPRIADIVVNTGSESYPIFEAEPNVHGTTPLVNSLTIRVEDDVVTTTVPGDYNADTRVDAADYVVWRRNRGQSVMLPNDDTPDGVSDEDYDTWRENFGAIPSNRALDLAEAERSTNYHISADFIGEVRIRQINVVPLPLMTGEPAAATIELVFDKPLPDGTYTLHISDSITDADGNELDGEFDDDNPSFPTGDGEPGGSFRGTFRVDSRPEIGSRSGTDIDVDINGNWFWDPWPFNDPEDADLTFSLLVIGSDGLPTSETFGTHDQLFAGRFVEPRSGLPDRLHDQLAAFGYLPAENSFRWLIDMDGDGVLRDGTDIVTTQGPISAFSINSALAIAGEFDVNRPGDEIGLYGAGKWAFDDDGDRAITDSDRFIANGLVGYPVVGDFDGDGKDDLAVFRENTWYFDLASDGLGDADTAAGATTPTGGMADHTLAWGLPGTQDRPVTADMDQDGIDDIGLWVPNMTTATAEWRFLMSNDLVQPRRRVTGEINTLRHAFMRFPSGNDIFIEFGSDRSRPIVGNFGPPPSGVSTSVSGLRAGAAATAGAPLIIGDVFGDSHTIQRTAPAKRVQFSPVIVDAVLLDGNLMLTNGKLNVGSGSISPGRDNGANSRDANAHDEELAVQFAWDELAFPVIGRTLQ